MLLSSIPELFRANGLIVPTFMQPQLSNYSLRMSDLRNCRILLDRAGLDEPSGIRSICPPDIDRTGLMNRRVVEYIDRTGLVNRYISQFSIYRDRFVIMSNISTGR